MCARFFDLLGVRAEFGDCSATAMQTDTRHGWSVSVHVGVPPAPLEQVIHDATPGRPQLTHDAMVCLAETQLRRFMERPASAPVLYAPDEPPLTLVPVVDSTTPTQATLDLLQLLLTTSTSNAPLASAS
jgi:hypothetical protein